MATPYATVEVDQVTSTQDEVRRWFDAVAPAQPLLLIADRQLRGRGRFGHEWWAAPRAVNASLAMRDPWPAQRLALLPLVAGLALRDAIGDMLGREVSLKWPNDLVTDSGKAGGILVEHAEPVIVVGCGVNLWWPGHPSGTDALFAEDPGRAVAREVTHGWVRRFLARVESGDWDRDAYAAACVTIGVDVEWDPDGKGTAVTIDESGGLVVHTLSGRETLRAGEVRHLRPATLPVHQEGEPEIDDT